VGAVITFNGLLNMAIAQDLTSLGIRLRQDRTDDDYGLALAWTFANVVQQFGYSFGFQGVGTRL
jgi:hypothetical protein